MRTTVQIHAVPIVLGGLFRARVFRNRYSAARVRKWVSELFQLLLDSADQRLQFSDKLRNDLIDLRRV